MKRKKILFYHPLFLDGGAERTNLLISEKFSKKYEVIFVSNVFSKIYSSEIRRIGIKKIELKAKRTITSFFELSKIINKYKPDIIFSVQMHASILALLINKILFKNKLKIICCERLSYRSYLKDFKGNIIIKLAQLLYKNAKKIICNSKELSDEIKKLCRSNNVTCIYNPTLTRNYKRLSKQFSVHEKVFSSKKKIIISIARLEKVKNHLMLLKAINHCKNKHNLNLVLIGEGKKKNEIIEFSKKNDFFNNLHILNYKKNPFPYLSKSDLFILTSDFEGMPNVLIEAMALNIPIISTRCPTGPKEILLNGKAGFLVNKNDYHSLSNKIDLFFSKPHIFKKKKIYYKKILTEFNSKIALKKYMSIVENYI